MGDNSPVFKGVDALNFPATTPMNIGMWRLLQEQKMIKTVAPMGRYSKARIVNGMVHLCGQFSTDLELGVQAQSLNTFDQVDTLLAECGTDKSKIVSILVHLHDIDADYTAFNEVYDQWIAGDEAPVRTCVQGRMFSEKCLVELTIIAAQ